MCGIYACISPNASTQLSDYQRTCLCQRGPDHVGTVSDIVEGHIDRHVTLTSTVLALRGDHIAPQPLIDHEGGFSFCWNGEAWKIRGQRVAGNDAEAVFALLANAKRAGGEDTVMDALRTIEGPFAFVFLDKRAKRIYYGRDRLGRRSLTIKLNGEGWQISSVADPAAPGWAEVEADGVYVLDLGHGPLKVLRQGWSENPDEIFGIGTFNSAVPLQPPKLNRSSASVEQLRRQLSESLAVRVLEIPVPPGGGNKLDARIAILFSGGLDCSVLARMAADAVPHDQAIDLLNVAFENPRIAGQFKGQDGVDLYELCPDRITGRKSFHELTQACPDRKWQFVTVDVPFSLATEHRLQVIRLLYPHNTEMDLSIGYALYFAARGIGQLQRAESLESVTYSTTARVLLSGLGADELFGGYQRHSISFSRRGPEGLANELKLDVSRLGQRNLGRDDRVMSHWGKEVRFPFLDENVVKWAIELPAWEKCDFGNPEGDDGIEPNKRILRLLAQNLGMTSVAAEKKRAIQFGARTAKMETGKVKGTSLITP